MQQCIHLPGQPEAVADHVFVRQAVAGDEGAFEALVRRYHTQVFHFIRHYISDYDQAWDVFQQVLLKLCASLPKLCLAQEQLGPWLFQVARNCCIDELRKKRMLCFSELEWDAEEEEGEPSLLASRADPSPSPEETVEYHEVQRMLLEAIDGLPSRSRLVVFLHYARQLSFTEIGQQLHMTTSAAKASFYRARPLLRATLTTQG